MSTFVLLISDPDEADNEWDSNDSDSDDDDLVDLKELNLKCPDFDKTAGMHVYRNGATLCFLCGGQKFPTYLDAYDHFYANHKNNRDKTQRLSLIDRFGIHELKRMIRENRNKEPSCSWIFSTDELA